jgi:hypothetical protein
MRKPIVLVALAALVGASAGGFAGCAAPVSQNDVSGDTSPATDAGGSADAVGTQGMQCTLCLSDKDCNGGVCAQFGGDIYCAPGCPNGNECGAGTSCTLVSTSAGDQASVCVPTSGSCAGTGGSPPGGGGSRTHDAGVAGTDAGGGNQMCGNLAGPTVSAHCSSCGSTHTCQANGCYGGWWCNTQTDKCQSPPSSCTAPSVDAGRPPPPPVDAGPVTGGIGGNGGTESSLYFGVVGDTRPPAIDDTSGYPTQVITQIMTDLAHLSPMPPFIVSTGDYMFASTTGGQAGTQLDMYETARQNYPGVQFPAMGNHECTGATTSNCGPNGTNGITDNMTQFMNKMLGPIGQTSPYYSINVDASDGSWTSKFVFIAANAWDSNQASWLQSTLAQSTTYTFIVRHEPRAASTAPGVSPSEQIMQQHPYTLAIVGHTHTYSQSSTKQVTIGNGGAPLTGGVNYGYAIVAQRASDKAITVDMYDYSTNQPDTSFHFAVNADGSSAPP